MMMMVYTKIVLPASVHVVFLTAVVVGLEYVRYIDLENTGIIEVCAAVLGECTASFPFTLSLYTSDDSAGNI